MLEAVHKYYELQYQILSSLTKILKRLDTVMKVRKRTRITSGENHWYVLLHLCCIIILFVVFLATSC